MRAALSAQGRGLARSRPVVGVNLPKARRAGVVQCAARKKVDANRVELEKAAREKAVALLAGLAATAVTFTAEPGMAAEDLAARSKQRVAELEATLGESRQLGAKLEAMLENGGAAPKVLTGSAKEELTRVNSEIKKILAEIESSVKDAVKSEESLQAQLAAKNAEAARLAAEIEASKKELELERKELMAAQAENKKNLPTKFMLEGVVGMTTVWGLGSYWAMKRAQLARDDPDGVQAIKKELLEAREMVERAKREVASERSTREALEKKFKDLQTRMERASIALGDERFKIENLERDLAELEQELKTERAHNAELRETINAMQAKYARMVHTAESETMQLRRSLFDLVDSFGPPKNRLGLPTPDTSRPVIVNFSLQRELMMGQSFQLVGNHPAMGMWDLREGPGMNWTDGHVWRAEVALPPGTTVEFKCVVREDGNSQWEEGPNHVLYVPANGTFAMDVSIGWGVGEVVTARRVTADQGPAHMLAGVANGLGHMEPELEIVTPDGQVLAAQFAQQTMAVPERGWYQ